TTSDENVEKVVNPPRNPVIANNRNSGGKPDLIAKYAAAAPTRYPPSRFAANVPIGTVGKSGLSTMPSHHRRQAPEPAPRNTQRIEYKAMSLQILSSGLCQKRGRANSEQ